MEFPGNSNTGKEKKPAPPVEEKKIEKVVTGEVVNRKKSIGRRFKEIFIRGEAKAAAGYITRDILLPALQNMFVDSVSKGAERMVYGENSPRRRVDPGRGRMSYNSISSPFQRPTMLPDQPPHYAKKRRDSNEIILASRNEAEMVVEMMSTILDKYEVVTVADLYDLVGLPTTYVDNKWGWTSLTHVDIRQTREGYLIDLPNVQPV